MRYRQRQRADFDRDQSIIRSKKYTLADSRGVAHWASNLSVFDSLAQSYPVKPIYMVVGYVAGGGVDTVAHRVSQKLRESFGQPVVVDNRPGASGSIANDR